LIYTLNVALGIPVHDRSVPERDMMVGGAVIIMVVVVGIDVIPLKVVVRV
jgi:hypothetical protein